MLIGNKNSLWVKSQDLTLYENLILKSEAFNLSPWARYGCSVSANVINSPFDDMVADKLVENSTTTTHYAVQTNIYTVVDLEYNLSCYVKSSGDGRTFKILVNARGNLEIFFNPDTETFYTSGTIISSNYTNEGDGWYRVDMTFTPNSTGNKVVLFQLYDGVEQSYLGDGVSGVYVFGSQLTQTDTVKLYNPNL